MYRCLLARYYFTSARKAGGLSLFLLPIIDIFPHLRKSCLCSTSHSVMDLRNMRKPELYDTDAFCESEIAGVDPFDMFGRWFRSVLASESTTFEEKNCFALGTASIQGRPSVRWVLLKGYDKDGFRFFTNYESRKGREIAENPFGCMTFYWPRFHNRQVRIEGRFEKLPESDSDEYFKMRPVGSQISAYVSPQSSVIASKEALEKESEEVREQFGEAGPPRKPNWGGYLLIPDRFEFWQGRQSRLHDRFVFRKPQQSDEERPAELRPKEAPGDWVYERLAP